MKDNRIPTEKRPKNQQKAYSWNNPSLDQYKASNVLPEHSTRLKGLTMRILSQIFNE
jgi:hypothetical protein